MRHREFPRLSLAISLWFFLDAVLVLAPPLHAFVSRHPAPMAGVPGTLLYFLAVSGCVALSVVAAYALESRAGESGP